MAGLFGSFQAQTGIDAIAGRSSYRIDMVRASQGIQAVNENVNQSSSASAEMSQNIAEVNHSAGEMSLSSDQVKTSADELQKNIFGPQCHRGPFQDLIERRARTIKSGRPFSGLPLFMIQITVFIRVLKNVMSAGQTRQNSAKKRSLCVINEHFEPNFNAVWPSAIVFQHPAKDRRPVP